MCAHNERDEHEGRRVVDPRRLHLFTRGLHSLSGKAVGWDHRATSLRRGGRAMRLLAVPAGARPKRADARRVRLVVVEDGARTLGSYLSSDGYDENIFIQQSS